MRLKEERYRFLSFTGRVEVAAGLGRALEDAGSGMVVVGRDKASATMEVVAGLGVTGSARRNGKCLLLVRHLPWLLFSSLPSILSFPISPSPPESEPPSPSPPPTVLPCLTPFPSHHYVSVAI